MRRSTLQRKDRDELTEIAAALGRKPPSRARKGEIIDLIIDLAAGGDGSSVLDTAGAKNAAEAKTAADAKSADGASEGEAAGSRGRTTGSTGWRRDRRPRRPW